MDDINERPKTAPSSSTCLYAYASHLYCCTAPLRVHFRIFAYSSQVAPA